MSSCMTLFFGPRECSWASASTRHARLSHTFRTTEQPPLMPNECSHGAHRGRSGFTLIELMVVVAILISLATLTAISVSKVTKDARFSKAVSQVMGALETARTLAIKEHRIVMVVFTVKTERTDTNVSGGNLTGIVKRQWTRIVAARLRDELVPDGNQYLDMFEQHPNFSPIDLPEGIKVAAPQMDFDRRDSVWITQPTFRDNNTNFTEMEYGSMIAVMFGVDGSLLTKITGGGTANNTYGRFAILDMDQDGLQRQKNSAVDSSGWFTYYIEGQEPNIQLAPFLSVFNDTAMRELYDVNNWKGNIKPSWVPGALCSTYNTGRTRMNCDQSEYINQFGDKIYFNRYTGRAEVQKR